MTEPRPTTPLPAGIVDVLPPFAAFEATAVEHVMAVFAGRGYERVKPPLLEFEDRLLAGSGAALAGRTFRLMDPLSQRMLALRPDFTLQVARIAAERLGHRARPLRLSYAGQVVRLRGSQLRPLRQLGQAGAELIGSDDPAADAEVIVMAFEALTGLGVRDVTVDLGLPTLVPAILADRCPGLGGDAAEELRAALDRKDTAAVAGLAPIVGGASAELLARLVDLVGPVEPALAALQALELPGAAAALRAGLAATIRHIRRDAPDLTLGLDPVERRGFEYHDGVTFALFACGARSDLGRGGRYRSAHGEPATGITLYMESVLEAAAAPRPNDRVLLPPGTPAAVARALRAAGWVTIAAFEPLPDVDAEARRLGCSHLLAGDTPRPVAAAAPSF